MNSNCFQTTLTTQIYMEVFVGIMKRELFWKVPQQINALMRRRLLSLRFS